MGGPKTQTDLDNLGLHGRPDSGILCIPRISAEGLDIGVPQSGYSGFTAPDGETEKNGRKFGRR